MDVVSKKKGFMSKKITNDKKIFSKESHRSLIYLEWSKNCIKKYLVLFFF